MAIAGAVIMGLLTRECFLSKKCSFPPTRCPAESMVKENSALQFSVHFMSKEEFKEGMSERKLKRRIEAFV